MVPVCIILGKPRICMRIKPAPVSAATFGIFSSNLIALTSLMISAPMLIASRATAAFVVSIDMGTFTLLASAPITGMTLFNSSSSGTGSEPGRVDSPPTSRIPAPASTRRIPSSTASADVVKRPTSEKESGVAFTMPMIKVRAPNIISLLEVLKEGVAFMFALIIKLPKSLLRFFALHLFRRGCFYTDDGIQLRRVQNFLLEQFGSQFVKNLHVVGQQFPCFIITFGNDPGYFLVYLFGGLFAVILVRGNFAA